MGHAHRLHSDISGGFGVDTLQLASKGGLENPDHRRCWNVDFEYFSGNFIFAFAWSIGLAGL